MAQRPRLAKVRGLRGARKYGVAAASLQELLRKGAKLLQLPGTGCRACLYEDGTEVTDGYFRHMPDNTDLVLLAPGETWQGCIEPRFRNKSSYMRYSCESRIRSYMKEVSSYISAVDPTAQAKYKSISDLMLDKLRSVKYNGCYFDRREEAAARICTSEGWFSCQGPFDMDACLCKHSLNPYSNRESRILFSTWNLDHVIEKKRTVIPTLAEAVNKQDGREVNWEYFYQLLFTMDNLKLVHIACHKKTNHNLGCDKTKIYRKRKRRCKVLK
ncbi:PREDICTED: DNA fragmentation factor subunit beta isoform X3 [Gavialis gangeticus]|uniref:DNA fragmentation factor subunit beta isoform X3 n=1 Tax=Gavialis gangeticus TaxID=94835 RepID=UPI00092EEB8A|nr:PREDICTED: DNA fragmentation factor subunit beta isoform X3 [Gavialis gangeticus]